MAARGTDEKNLVISKILEAFPSAFEYGKEIRVPVNDVQIKITLACAKDNVEISGTSTPASVFADDGFPSPVGSTASAPEVQNIAEPTEEELENVRTIMEKLGL